MPVIRITASTDDIVEAVAQLPTEELAAFVERVATLRAERVAPHAPADEAALLLRIGRGLPPARRRRYDALLLKRDEEMLSPEEHDELIRLTDELEQLQAERAEAIVALARLRRMSPVALLTSLGLRPASDGA